jgi:hypothetical protein
MGRLTTRLTTLAGELTDTDHYLFVSEVRERFVISQQAGRNLL